MRNPGKVTSLMRAASLFSRFTGRLRASSRHRVILSITRSPYPRLVFSNGAVIEARDRLAERGIHADYLRIRALPFTHEVEDFLHAHDTIFVVEQNAVAALGITDRAYVLETGEIVLEGRAEDLMHNPEVKRAYLGKGYKEVWE